MHSDSEVQKFYLDARAHISDFRNAASVLLDKDLSDDSEELIKKYRTLLAFDFEAAVRLKHWESLCEILYESRQVADDTLYGLFADCILCSDCPTEEIVKIFEIIIQAYHKTKPQNIDKVSRWIRCAFQLSIESSPEAAESVLDQAYILARDGPEYQNQRPDEEIVQGAGSSSTQLAYPNEELEWLATTAFNHAIDLYLASDDTASRRWYGKALDLARLLHDNGGLWQILQEKFGRLSWDD
ncbi:predicted protein [Uncinocarpus reesii 1704]|uniref:Uncharacterized protein n=1 Tax=Uncinocarpus reesii (strain UAMH 1704) TaxID=336963 RepID=C4JXN0_UNCRE|nr:uncharacterized protein UREG_06403 [Uncinocarpus reesii 1704]EEP81538.1 predicted protein [Uncinocarpus reesii 1704]